MATVQQDPESVKVAIPDDTQRQEDSGEKTTTATRAASSLIGSLKSRFVVFVNPKFVRFNRPCLIAMLVGLATTVIWLMVLNSMLGACTTESMQTTSRSEMIDFLSAEPTGWATGIYNNNRFKNLDCIHYTAKLTQTAGHLEMKQSWESSSDECTYAGKNWDNQNRDPFTGDNLSPTYDDRGRFPDRQPYTEYKTFPWKTKATIPGNTWMTSGGNTDKCPGAASWVAKPGLLRYQKCDLGPLQKSPAGVPEGKTAKKDFVWVAAGDLRDIPGAMSQVSKFGLPKNHPMNQYIRSQPWLGWGSEVRPSSFLTLKSTFEFDRGDTLGTGFFPNFDNRFTMSDKELHQLLMIGDNQDVVVRLRAANACGHNDTSCLSAWEATRHDVRMYELKLMNRDAVDLGDWTPNALVWEGKFLTRDKLCNKDDFKDYILFKNVYGEDCQPGGYYWNEHGGDEDAMISDKRCTVLRRCDLSGFDESDFTAMSSQSEYGAFLVSYRKCPELMATLGASLGYTGQIELVLTIFFLTLLMACGAIRITSEDGTDTKQKGWKAMLRAAEETAAAPDEVGDAIAELKMKEQQREEREAAYKIEADK